MPIQRFTRSIPVKVQPRKVKYATDVEYREKSKRLSRRTYRRKAKVELKSCLYSLPFLDRIKTPTTVLLPSGKKAELLALSVPKTAQMLQLLYQTFWRWVDHGTVPKPVLRSVTARVYLMYSVEEVRVLIEEIGGHQKEVSYLRKDHTIVRERIEQRFIAIRKTLGIK
ncbi:MULTISPECIES: hypothetical protein [unclassified Bradyrhizobium]|uniref:hypothetical protein n=1 Tax=unclassified Bradyrhizobium TaxID=2631580 RepID=UPI00339864AB